MRLLILLICSFSCLHSVEKIVSKTGYYTLEWPEQKEGIHFELFEKNNAATEAGSLVYNGKNKKIFQSGRQNGFYYYGLRAQGTATWLKQWSVQVNHHAFSFAFALFSAGALVFLITAISIVHLHKRSKKSQP